MQNDNSVYHVILFKNILILTAEIVDFWNGGHAAWHGSSLKLNDEWMQCNVYSSMEVFPPCSTPASEVSKKILDWSLWAGVGLDSDVQPAAPKVHFYTPLLKTEFTATVQAFYLQFIKLSMVNEESFWKQVGVGVKTVLHTCLIAL